MHGRARYGIAKCRKKRDEEGTANLTNPANEEKNAILGLLQDSQDSPNSRCLNYRNRSLPGLRSPQREDGQLGRAGEADGQAGGADAAGDEEFRSPAGEAAVDVFPAVFDGDRGVAEERHPALAAMGVAG